MYLNEELQNKWADVLNVEGLDPIKDSHRRSVTAIVLENTQRALNETSLKGGSQTLLETPVNAMGSSSSTASSGAIDTFDPILISLVRRSMPNLIAYDVCGVQPMTGPTGLIFALRARYANQTHTETFYNEVNTAFTGVGGLTGVDANTFGNGHLGTIPGATNTSPLTATNTYNFGQGMTTAAAEALGSSGGNTFPEMAFSIEKLAVIAKTRALKAEYTMELAQDLKAIHGLDAETELSNILTAEVLAEINREVIRTINVVAKIGSQQDTTTAGVFNLDTDANGRWSVEKFKGMLFHFDREANRIAQETRRGKGNIIICSSDVASAMNAAGVLDYTPALSNNLQVDDTGNTFAGLLNGRIKVYIDPYAVGGNYITMGYKGPSAFDSGLFYCPYVPLQMVRAVDQDSFQPKIGFKTRYGMVANPFAKGATPFTDDGLAINSNVYYRKTIITNLM